MLLCCNIVLYMTILLYEYTARLYCYIGWHDDVARVWHAYVILGCGACPVAVAQVSGFCGERDRSCPPPPPNRTLHLPNRKHALYTLALNLS